MTDDAARSALARLVRTTDDERSTDRPTPSAGDGERSYRETIERATAAVESVEDAARFVDEVGLDELERAVERAEESVSACAADGRAALETVREFREAAAGDQFHRGHGTSLGDGDVARRK